MLSTHSLYQWDGLKIHRMLAKFLTFETRKVLCECERQRQGLYAKDNGYSNAAMTALLSYCQGSCAAAVLCYCHAYLGILSI